MRQTLVDWHIIIAYHKMNEGLINQSHNLEYFDDCQQFFIDS